jgi:hypothetical protein
MKDQHLIDESPPYEWHRPSKVTLQDGVLQCVLGDRYYSLQDSYRLSPHAQFLNARTDSDLCVFVKAWGPLYVREDQRNTGITSHSLRELHAERRWLAALLGTFTAIESESAERESLQEFVEAAEEHDKISALYNLGKEAFPLVQVRDALHVQGSLSEWVSQATMREIRSAVHSVVEINSQTLAPLAGLRIVRRGKKSLLKSQWALFDLQTTLKWMIWCDFDRRDPLYCCEECRGFFKSESKHQRKFCNGPRCAKRVAARNWRRKDLAKKRLEKEANKERGK